MSGGSHKRAREEFVQPGPVRRPPPRPSSPDDEDSPQVVVPQELDETPAGDLQSHIRELQRISAQDKLEKNQPVQVFEAPKPVMLGGRKAKPTKQKPDVGPSPATNDDKPSDEEAKPIEQTTSEGKDATADQSKEAEDDEDSSDDSESSEENEEEKIRRVAPVSHVAELRNHDKTVSAIAVDPAGARLLAGSYDYQVSFWDFAGMTKSLKSFRKFEPAEGHPIRALDWSLSGDTFLVASGSQPALFDRNGLELSLYAKGYQFIADMNNTEGHVGNMTTVQWHPTDKSCFLTAAIDSTVRLWDVGQYRKQKSVIKCRNEGNTKTAVTAARFDKLGHVYAACQDGSLQMFDVGVSRHRPQYLIRNAHEDGAEVTSIRLTNDGRFVLSRGTDATLKVWDARHMVRPLRIFENLPNNCSETSIATSPNDEVFCTGTSVETSDGTGSLVFFDKRTLTEKMRQPVSKGSVVSIVWHMQLNQMFVGGTDTVVRCFYDPQRSRNGILKCIGRQAKRHHVDDDEIAPRPIITPIIDDEDPETRRNRDRRDPVQSKRPEPPINGPGHGGRVNQTGPVTMYLKNHYLSQDPREALLKYAQQAEDNPQFVNKAYAKTQPKPVFDLTPYEEREAKKGTNKERKERAEGKGTWGGK